MRDRVFLDTNIIIYLYSEDEDDKRDTAYKFLNESDCVTSIQAMNEASNVWLRKHSLSKDVISRYLNEIELVCDDILLVKRKTINQALELRERFDCSFYDCLMLASALEAGCNIILTEDMNNGQVIDGILKILNPF